MTNQFPVTPEKLAAQSLCKVRAARRYLERKHGAPTEGAWLLTVEEYGAAYDALRQIGRVVSGRAAYSSGAASLAKSGAQTRSRRET